MNDSTADYVRNVYQSRSEDAARMLETAQDGESEAQDTAWQELAEYPLAMQRKILVTITLGAGGPGDWIDAVCSTFEGELGIESATYTAVWGSDRKVTDLIPSDSLWKLAEHYIEGMEA